MTLPDSEATPVPVLRVSSLGAGPAIVTLGDKELSGKDLSGGAELGYPSKSLDLAVIEGHARLWYRGIALAMAAGVLLVLVVSLGQLTAAFTEQIRRGIPAADVQQIADATVRAALVVAASAPPASSAVRQPPAAPNAASAGATTQASASSSHSGAGALALAAIKWDPGPMANAVVAMVTVLVVAIVVVSLGLVRATFALRHAKEEAKDASESSTDKDKQDDGIALPAIELVKGISDAISTFMKSGKSKG